MFICYICETLYDMRCPLFHSHRLPGIIFADENLRLHRSNFDASTNVQHIQKILFQHETEDFITLSLIMSSLPTAGIHWPDEREFVIES